MELVQREETPVMTFIKTTCPYMRILEGTENGEAIVCAETRKGQTEVKKVICPAITAQGTCGALESKSRAITRWEPRKILQDKLGKPVEKEDLIPCTLFNNSKTPENV